MTNSHDAHACAILLQAIGEENRIRILECLWDGPKNVSELSKMLKLKVVNVSHHLGVLKAARLVVAVKEGRFVIHSLAPAYFESKAGKAGILKLGWCDLTMARR